MAVKEFHGCFNQQQLIFSCRGVPVPTARRGKAQKWQGPGAWAGMLQEGSLPLEVLFRAIQCWKHLDKF